MTRRAAHPRPTLPLRVRRSSSVRSSAVNSAPYGARVYHYLFNGYGPLVRSGRLVLSRIRVTQAVGSASADARNKATIAVASSCTPEPSAASEADKSEPRRSAVGLAAEGESTPLRGRRRSAAARRRRSDTQSRGPVERVDS